jgi:hypothetical protein
VDNAAACGVGQLLSPWIDIGDIDGACAAGGDSPQPRDAVRLRQPACRAANDQPRAAVVAQLEGVFSIRECHKQTGNTFRW